MKKIKLSNKLTLNKETMSSLKDKELNHVQGGAQAFLSLWTCKKSKCNTCDCNSTPNNPATCQGATCIFLDGC